MSIIGLKSLETKMKVSGPNCYDLKKPSVLGQNIRSSQNSAYFKKRFLNNFDSCLEYKIVSYTLVYKPCFEEVYLDIRNQSGSLLCEAGLYCRVVFLTWPGPPGGGVLGL